MPNKLIIIGLVFLLFSCRYTRVPSYLKKEFKYEPHIDTLAQEKIQLAKGFYRELMIDENMPITQGLCFKSYYFDSKDSSLRENTGYYDIMFFENGLCFAGHLNPLRWEINPKEFHRSVEEGIRLNKPGYFSDVVYSFWGPYEIKGDTVKIKVLIRNSLMSASVGAYEQLYRIIDKNTLRPMQFKGLIKGHYNKQCDSVVKLNPKYYPDSKFIPLQYININPNYNWIMNKKWFWRNKQDYVRWKKSYSIN